MLNRRRLCVASSGSAGVCDLELVNGLEVLIVLIVLVVLIVLIVLGLLLLRLLLQRLLGMLKETMWLSKVDIVNGTASSTAGVTI